MPEYPILQALTGLADEGLELLQRDDLQAEYATGSLLHVGDTAFRPFSFAGVSPVVEAAPINDVAETSVAARMRVIAGGTPPVVTTRGIDFSPVTRGLTHIEVPASVMAGLASTQNFHACVYLTFPSEANWPPASLPSGRAILDQTTGNATSSSQAELFSVWIASAAGEQRQLRLRRQTSIGNSDTVAISPVSTAAPHIFGAFAQLSVRRDADGVAMRVRTATGDTTVTMARGANNSEAGLASRLIRLGCGHWTQAGLNADEQKARTGLTFGRWWFARPEGAARDFNAILDADWARVAPRFS